MVERIVVIGAGGFGRETLDIAEAMIAAGEPIEILGVVDAGPRGADLARLAERNINYLGTEDEWLPMASEADRFVVAIGSPADRMAVSRRLSAAGLRPRTLVHPRAVIGTQARIGAGVVVAAGVQVSTNVTLGDHVHLNPGCIVGHDAFLSEFVSVNPGAIVSGNVTVERGALLGAGSVVLQGLRVGTASTVGAAACVTRAVADGAVVKGVPAR